MTGDSADPKKRRFLIGATTAVGAVGAVTSVLPFVFSMFPSERAKAAGAPVEVDISKLEPGMLLTVEWRGKPVWIVNRTKEMLDQLAKGSEQLADPESGAGNQPDYAKNALRARQEHSNILVVEGVCTHLGCSPTFRKEVGPADLGADWPGGFYCPCHGSKFDLAARVFKGVPAPKNLNVPPYAYLTDTMLLIGQDSAAKGA
jgi:ubiquinol-cytochrome c reductase iron-sulfur subunit